MLLSNEQRPFRAQIPNHPFLLFGVVLHWPFTFFTNLFFIFWLLLYALSISSSIPFPPIQLFLMILRRIWTSIPCALASGTDITSPNSSRLFPITWPSAELSALLDIVTTCNWTCWRTCLRRISPIVSLLLATPPWELPSVRRICVASKHSLTKSLIFRSIKSVFGIISRIVWERTSRWDEWFFFSFSFLYSLWTERWLPFWKR